MSFNFKKKNFIYTYRDFYRQYKKKKRASGFKPREIIDELTYRRAMEDFFILVCRKIIKESFIFVLPLAMGYIYMKGTKCPPDKAYIDWVATKKLKKIVRYLNLHTFGYFYTVRWKKSHVRFTNKTIYKFSLVGGPHAKEKGSGKGMISEHLLNPDNPRPKSR